MDIGVIFPPTMDTPAHIELAEELGYSHACVYDSPSFLADPWITLADAAARTSRIVLGVAVVTPMLRHLVATAGAVATLRMRAPGRLVMGVGTGFTSQRMLGKGSGTWPELEAFVIALRGLLEGRDVEWDGAVVSLRYGALTGIEPGPVPIWVAAHGPKGFAVAERSADGIVNNPTHGIDSIPPALRDQTYVLYYGTVLDPGEDLGSERVVDAAGPTAAFQMHIGSVGVAGDTATRAYAAAIEQVDERVRHLEMHSGHLIEVKPIERPLITPEVIARTTGSGTPEEVGARLDEIAAAGIAGVLYGPQGPDLERELRVFADVAGLG